MLVVFNITVVVFVITIIITIVNNVLLMHNVYDRTVGYVTSTFCIVAIFLIVELKLFVLCLQLRSCPIFVQKLTCIVPVAV